MKINKRLMWKIISIARVWFQSFLSFEVVLHIKDIINFSNFWGVCLAAFIPVAIRWATPADQFPDEAHHECSSNKS